MARVDWVEARLKEWAEWVRSQGQSDKGTGLPTRNCLDPDWGRPGQGAVPSFKVVTPGLGSITHYHLCSLSVTLQQTLLLHYVENRSVISIAKSMECAVATIDQRIWRAHATLSHMLR